MIFIDSNIPMYLVGAPHANKGGAQRLLEHAIGQGERLVTNVEVLQEILHRYTSIDRRDAIQPAFDALLQVVDEVFPIELVDLHRAKAIVLERSKLPARDALHAAVMERRRVATVMSFDTDFDHLPGLERLS